MALLTETQASDLFRSPPGRMIPARIGEVALRSVGSGPDVLFVHGWPVNSATFRRLLPHLAEHVTCHLIDLPGAGSSSYTADDPVTIDSHIAAVETVIEALDVDLAVVGHDSGGLITRHAVVDNARVRAVGLIDTEPADLGWRFKMFLANRNVPGFGAMLRWVAGQKKLRRNGFVLGDAFVDRDLLDGEFDEFFLEPLQDDPKAIAAGMRLLKSLDINRHVKVVSDIHRRIDVPVQLVWGAEDKFFPIESARAMVAEFPNADLAEISNAGLFSHEERPAEVAAALLPVLRGDGQLS